MDLAAFGSLSLAGDDNHGYNFWANEEWGNFSSIFCLNTSFSSGLAAWYLASR